MKRERTDERIEELTDTLQYRPLCMKAPYEGVGGASVHGVRGVVGADVLILSLIDDAGIPAKRFSHVTKYYQSGHFIYLMLGSWIRFQAVDGESVLYKENGKVYHVVRGNFCDIG